jgi:hypothetical protein
MHQPLWTIQRNVNSTPTVVSCCFYGVKCANPSRKYDAWSLPTQEFLTPNPKKVDFGGWCGKKEHQSDFCRSGHFGRSEWKKAFKKRQKNVQNCWEAFWSVKKVFWSGNNRSWVLFSWIWQKWSILALVWKFPQSRGSRYTYIYVYTYIVNSTCCFRINCATLSEE